MSEGDVIEEVGGRPVAIEIEQAHGKGYWLFLRAYDRSGGMAKEVELEHQPTLLKARRRAKSIYKQLTKDW